MAHFTITRFSGTRSKGRVGRRRFYHWRLCRFEPLELRQVLSASLGTDGLADLATGSLDLLQAKTHQSAGPMGMTPFQIQSAYGFYVGTQANFGITYDLNGNVLKAGNFNNNIKLAGNVVGNGKGETVAIIDPGNDPTIVADTKAFSLQFGLPLFNVAGGPTLKVVNQNGSTNPAVLPLNDPDTSVEISLDVEWVHAIAPEANILLVEVVDPFSPNSGGALDPTEMFLGNMYARSQPGVVVVSNSWGRGEGLGENAEDPVFTTPSGHAGVQFVVSAGDSGGPADYPSASPNVLSVGGTSLTLTSSNSYSGETVWNNLTGAGGGGESAFLVQEPPVGLQPGSIISLFPLENVPNYQYQDTASNAGVLPTLTGRGTPDVSYDADPNTGFAVYDSYAFGAATPWEEIGGTSAGAPQWSALIAIADQGRAQIGKGSLTNVQSIVYKLPATDFHDILTGNNNLLGTLFPGQGFDLGITGNAAGRGYDLASGLGTPIANLVINGLVAFNGSTVVSSTRPAVANSAGTFYFFTKPTKVMTADGGSGDDSGIVASPTDASNSASIAADALALDQDSASDNNADSVALQSVSLHYDDTASLQFGSDSHDDGTNLSHHFHGMHDADADSSSAVLDDYFATI